MKSVYRIIGQGSKSVDFLAGQVAEQGAILGQQNVTVACPKDNLEFKFFSTPGKEFYLGTYVLKFIMQVYLNLF